MSHETAVSTETLDDLYETLAGELAALVELSERYLAEMEAIDDLRPALWRHGGAVVAARGVRCSAIRSRTEAIESRQRARDNYQRAFELVMEFDDVTSRAHALLDESARRSARRRARAEGARGADPLAPADATFAEARRARGGRVAVTPSPRLASKRTRARV